MSQIQNSFRIELRGTFDVRWADYLGDMLTHVEADEGKRPTTTLYGHAVDLAAFLGSLNTLVDLGYPIINFEYQNADLVNEMDGEEV